MKKQYKQMIGILSLLFCVCSFQKTSAKEKELPWQLRWEQKKEYPYFKEETTMIIERKEQADPTTIHVLINNKEQEIKWKDGKEGSITLKKDGVYQITILDDEKVKQEETVWIETTDPSIPHIDCGSYEEGKWTNQDIHLKPTDSKAVSGIDYYEYKHLGGKWSKLRNNEISICTSMRDELFFRAVSKAGRKSESKRILIRLWKETPPIGQIVLPAADQNGWYHKIPEVTWKEEFSEGPKLQPYFEIEDIERKEVTVTERLPFIKKEGCYKLITWSIDEAGNHSKKSKPVFVNIDFTNPKILIDYKNQWKNQEYCKRQEASIKVMDKNLLESGLKLYTSGQATTSWKKIPGGYEKEISFEKEGKHFLQVVAKDQAGNEIMNRKEFIVDRTPPKIMIDGAQDFQSYDKNIQWNIKGKDDSPYNMETFVYENKKRIEEKMLRKDGYYTIQVKALDAAGNASQKQIHFVINKMGIVIKAKNTAIEGKRINGKNVRPGFLVESLEPVQVTGFFVNGIPRAFQWKGKEVLLQKPIREDGDYQIHLILSDASGKKAVSDKLSFTYDGKAPKLLIHGLNSEKKISYGEKLKLCLEDKTDFFVSLFMDGKKLSAKQSEISILQKEIGKHEITFTAKDKAGNISSGKITFTVEKVMPQVLKGIFFPKQQKKLETKKAEKRRKEKQSYGIFLWCVLALVSAGFAKNMAVRL